jgi:hypothetical protein
VPEQVTFKSKNASELKLHILRTCMDIGVCGMSNFVNGVGHGYVSNNRKEC